MYSQVKQGTTCSIKRQPLQMEVTEKSTLGR